MRSRFIFAYSFFSLFIAILIFYNLNSCNKYKNFQNLNLKIQYVGKDNCKKCHEEIFNEFAKSGMGHSFYKPGTQPWIENFHNATVFDKHSNLYYQAFLSQNNLFIKEFRLNEKKDTIFSHLWKINWIVGSGRQTRSYIVEKNGFLYEAPITWYSNKKIWDLSPGYHEGFNSGFRRPLGEECIHCHNGYSSFSEGSINHFQSIAQSIDCERCHGPGEIHSQNMEKDLIVDVGKGEIDYSIVNPKHLSIDKQLDICQQCHLQGIVVTQNGKRFQDYRPGLYIHQFFDVFTVENPNNQQSFGIASHAERLKKSACFQKSKMTCTTCHNPHQPTDLLLALQACKQCHSEPHQKKCSLKNTEKNFKTCIQCHLNQSGTSDIPHVQFTDHFIRIMKEEPKVLSPQKIQAIQLYCQTQNQLLKDTKSRAYWNYYETRNSQPFYLDTIQKFGFENPSLEAAKFYIYKNDWNKALKILQEFQPLNLQEKVWNHILLAEVYENQNVYEDAIFHYNKAYELQPYQIHAKLKSVLLSLKNSDGSLKSLEIASQSLMELYQKNPWDYFILLNLGKVHNDLRNYKDAEKYLLEALQVYPNGLEALKELEKLYQRNRDLNQAQKIRLRIQQTENLKDKIQ